MAEHGEWNKKGATLSDYLSSRTAQTELRKINKEINELQKKIIELQVCKGEIEKSGLL